MHNQMLKTWKETYQFYDSSLRTVVQTAQHAHTRISTTETCIVFSLAFCDRHPVVKSAPAAGSSYICMNLCADKSSYTRDYAFIWFTLTGSVLYLTFTLKSLSRCNPSPEPTPPPTPCSLHSLSI